MSTATILALTGLVTAIGGLAAGIAAIISAARGHNVVNNQVKPQAQANTDAIVRLAQDSTVTTEAAVKKIINGAAASGNQPG